MPPEIEVGVGYRLLVLGESGDRIYETDELWHSHSYKWEPVPTRWVNHILVSTTSPTYIRRHELADLAILGNNSDNGEVDG